MVKFCENVFELVLELFVIVELETDVPLLLFDTSTRVVPLSFVIVLDTEPFFGTCIDWSFTITFVFGPRSDAGLFVVVADVVTLLPSARVS